MRGRVGVGTPPGWVRVLRDGRVTVEVRHGISGGHGKRCAGRAREVGPGVPGPDPHELPAAPEPRSRPCRLRPTWSTGTGRSASSEPCPGVGSSSHSASRWGQPSSWYGRPRKTPTRHSRSPTRRYAQPSPPSCKPSAGDRDRANGADAGDGEHGDGGGCGVADEVAALLGEDVVHAGQERGHRVGRLLFVLGHAPKLTERVCERLGLARRTAPCPRGYHLPVWAIVMARQVLSSSGMISPAPSFPARVAPTTKPVCAGRQLREGHLLVGDGGGDLRESTPPRRTLVHVFVFGSSNMRGVHAQGRRPPGAGGPPPGKVFIRGCSGANWLRISTKSTSLPTASSRIRRAVPASWTVGGFLAGIHRRCPRSASRGRSVAPSIRRVTGARSRRAATEDRRELSHSVTSCVGPERSVCGRVVCSL
jgi:hypothetical protein